MPLSGKCKFFLNNRRAKNIIFRDHDINLSAEEGLLDSTDISRVIIRKIFLSFLLQVRQFYFNDVYWFFLFLLHYSRFSIYISISFIIFLRRTDEKHREIIIHDWTHLKRRMQLVFLNCTYCVLINRQKMKILLFRAALWWRHRLSRNLWKCSYRREDFRNMGRLNPSC